MGRLFALDTSELMFQGGPQPLYGVTRPLSEYETSLPNYVAIPAEEDHDWKRFVQCGGAGDRADSEEEQLARYSSVPMDGIEMQPGSHIFKSRPDLIATASLDYTIKTFDTTHWKQVQLFEGHIAMVNCVQCYHGDRILSAGDDATARLWKIGTDEMGELLMTYWCNVYCVKAVCSLPGQRAATGGLDRILRVISLLTGNVLHRIEDHGKLGPENNFFQSEGCGQVWAVRHIRGNILASGADDATIRLWDIDTGKCLRRSYAHFGYGEDIGVQGWGRKLSEKFAAIWFMVNVDERRFASCCWDRTLCIWDASDIADIKEERRWIAGDNSILKINMVARNRLASAGSDKYVCVWDTETGICMHKIFIQRGMCTCITRIDDDVMVLGGGDCTLRIYDWKEGKDLEGPRGFIAHDFIIMDVCSIHSYQADDEHWIQEPIMYATCSIEQSEADYKETVGIHQFVLRGALNYSEIEEDD